MRTQRLKQEPNLRTSPVRQEVERRLVEIIAGFVGPVDMVNSGAFWRVIVIRNFPTELIEEAVGEGEHRARTAYVFEHRGRWLIAMIRKLSGLVSLRDLPPGPHPIP